jgi:hypothetical protein
MAGFFRQLVIDPQQSNILWQAINQGLPTSWATFMSVAVDPTDSQRIYPGMGGSVYCSGYRGDAWIQVAGALNAEDRGDSVWSPR